MIDAAIELCPAGFGQDAVNAEPAKRMGVGGDDPRLKLTALAQQGSSTDWNTMTVDEIIGAVDATYAEFLVVTAGVRQPI